MYKLTLGDSEGILRDLRGLSTGDFSEALPALLGPEAAGFSASTISRLVKIWQDKYRVWLKRSLEGKDYVYIWTDGVHFRVRLEEDRVACLVIIGVLADGAARRSLPSGMAIGNRRSRGPVCCET